MIRTFGRGSAPNSKREQSRGTGGKWKLPKLPRNVGLGFVMQILAVLVGARPGCDRIGSASAKHTKNAKIPAEHRNHRISEPRPCRAGNLGRQAKLRNEHPAFFTLSGALAVTEHELTKIDFELIDGAIMKCLARAFAIAIMLAFGAQAASAQT